MTVLRFVVVPDYHEIRVDFLFIHPLLSWCYCRKGNCGVCDNFVQSSGFINNKCIYIFNIISSRKSRYSS